MIDCLKQLESEIHQIPPSVDLKSADESFKQGWQEMLAGEIYPIEDLWKKINIIVH